MSVLVWGLSLSEHLDVLVDGFLPVLAAENGERF